MANLELNPVLNGRRRLPAEAALLPRDPMTAQRARGGGPNFSQVDAGQLIRTAVLVLLCLGVSFLLRGEMLPAQGPAAQSVPLKS